MLELTGDNLLLPFYSWMRRNNRKLEFVHNVKILNSISGVATLRLADVNIVTLSVLLCTFIGIFFLTIINCVYSVVTKTALFLPAYHLTYVHPLDTC